jgi:flagellar protein FliO/FliZ
MRNDMQYLTSNCLWVFQALPLLAMAGNPMASPPANTTQPLTLDYLVQFSLGLIVVLTAVLALVWVLRRVGKLQTSLGGSLKTLGGLSLGARERIILVQVGETQLLLGIAPGRIQTLHVLDKPLKKTSGARDGEPQDKFAKRLAVAMYKGLDKQNTTQ